MMTKEEVTSIVTYCQMHNVSYSKRLKELGVPTWKFYEYKSRYASEPQAGKAEFVQITDGKDVTELLPRAWKALHPDN